VALATTGALHQIWFHRGHSTLSGVTWAPRCGARAPVDQWERTLRTHLGAHDSSSRLPRSLTWERAPPVHLLPATTCWDFVQRGIASHNQLATARAIRHRTTTRSSPITLALCLSVTGHDVIW